MLSGRYPSDEFAELRPRITWDRIGGHAQGAPGRAPARDHQRRHDPRPRPLRRVPRGAATASDRCASASSTRRWCSSRARATCSCSARRRGASRRSRTTACRCRPAPGEPGKMPFWHGDRPGRPLEFGRAIGELGAQARGRRRASEALARLTERASASTGAPRRTCVDYLSTSRPRRPARCRATARSWSSASSTRSATGACACSRRSARACTRRGRWRSRRGCASRAAPRSRAMWSDDGMVFRLPESDEPPPDASGFCPRPTRSRSWSSRASAATALFAARFRENAARALLLPRRRPGPAQPALGAAQARRRPARGRLALRLVPDPARDLPRVPARRVRPAGLVELLSDVERRRLRVVTVESRAPSPFAASLLFSYVANFIYDGDAPLAERRAQALSSTTRSCASCSARPSCASCSTPTRSTPSSARCSGSTRARCATPTAARPAARARRSDRGRDRAARRGPGRASPRFARASSCARGA